VTYSRNKTPGQWKAHGHYIARESATQKGEIKAVGFTATERAVDVSERLGRWQAAGDERMFKLIVSPEFGQRMDLERHARDLMKRIEKSLGTKLEWVAVVHCNTDHPHIHIALRGIDESGESLRLPRAFIQSGIRWHAEELATKELGYRTERDALDAQRREVVQLRFTSLDRIIQRSSPQEANYFTARRNPGAPDLSGFRKAQEQHLASRLAKLEQIGLAANSGHHTWLVRGDFEQVLRTMQRTTDRQKMLARHAALVSDERLPLQITPFPAISALEGRVLGHGQEENTDRPYLLLEGVEGKIHFLSQNKDIQAARRQGRLRVNSFVRIEKQFSGAQPSLRIEDLGDSVQLLQNETYFRKTALSLLQQGVLDVEPSWGGWLGNYQKCLRSSIVTVRHQEKTRRLVLER
jgi:type IV secretory pathway VirD2 relaxase